MLPSRFRLKLPPSWNRNYPDFKANTPLFKLVGKQVPNKKAPRIGFIISTKVGKAVIRNRIRRQLESILRASLEKSSSPVEVIIIVYPTCSQASYEELSASLNQVLPKIHLK